MNLGYSVLDVLAVNQARNYHSNRKPNPRKGQAPFLDGPFITGRKCPIRLVKPALRWTCDR